MDLLKFLFNYKRLISINPETRQETEVFYPYLPCSISSSFRSTPAMDGLLDSGSDRIVLPLEVAEYLGLELKPGEPMKIVGAEAPSYTSRVSITLGRGGRCCGPIKNVEVSIPREGETPLILGRNPIFELYRITFIEAQHRYEMIPYLQE